MGWEDRDYYREPAGGGIGGRLTGHSVVTWLLGINAVVFLLDSVLSSGSRTGSWASLSAWGNFNIAQGIFGFQFWRLVTYQFLHADFFHILFNMIGLYFFGPMLERWWGSRRFVAFYLLCGISGAAVMMGLAAVPGLLGVTTGTPLVGASGSLFGILAGAAVLYPHQRVMLLFPPVPMTLRTMALVFLGLATLSLIAGSPNAGGEAAHLGGALLGWVLVRHPRWLDFADGGGRSGPAGSPLGRLKRKLAESQRRQLEEEDREVDRILEKVRRQGLQSLSRKEKKLLARATERQRRAG